MLGHAPSGSRCNDVPVVAPWYELRGNGLLHRDHRQHLYRFEGSWNFKYASAGGYGDVASPLYGKLTADSRSWQRRWGTDPAPGTHRPWPSPVETEGTSSTNAHPQGAGSCSIDPLQAAGYSTLNPHPRAERHPTCLSEPESGEAGWRRNQTPGKVGV